MDFLLVDFDIYGVDALTYIIERNRYWISNNVQQFAKPREGNQTIVFNPEITSYAIWLSAVSTVLHLTPSKARRVVKREMGTGRMAFAGEEFGEEARRGVWDFVREAQGRAAAVLETSKRREVKEQKANEKITVFGGRLLAALEAKGISRREALLKFELNESTFSRYVNGKCVPGLPRLCHLADQLGVSVDYLLGREEKL